VLARRLGEFYGVSVYVLYRGRSTPGESVDPGYLSYVRSLARLLAEAILSSSSLSRIATSARPLLSQRIRYGKGSSRRRSLLWARILDDVTVCRTRAFYTVHHSGFSRADLRESHRRGAEFVDELLRAIKDLSTKGTENRILSAISCDKSKTRFYIDYVGRNGDQYTIVCRPDVIIVCGYRGALRTLVIEVGETDIDTVLRYKHVFPRLLLYMLALYLHYGFPSIGTYVPLSSIQGNSSIALLLAVDSVDSSIKCVRWLHSVLEKVVEICDLEFPPPPSSRPWCCSCIYSRICPYRGWRR